MKLNEFARGSHCFKTERKGKMSSEQQKHKAGPLKQKNKSHKYGRHRTKGLIDNANRGKIAFFSFSKTQMIS